MTDFTRFLKDLAETRLAPHQQAFADTLKTHFDPAAHGNLERWQQALTALPKVQPSSVALNEDRLRIGAPEDLTEEQRAQAEQSLRELHPWRKGPFEFFGIHIDTEWRSDWKWQRVLPHISPLKGRYVLDVGCGSGYHCWRMRGEGAAFVVGIDPSALFLTQFHTVKRYVPDEPVHFLPLKSEDLPEKLEAFDTVFSMGVLYHRKAPFDHLEELKNALRPGGELVLETLVVEGDANTLLLPEDRYAQMRNVWLLPSPEMLVRMVQRIGFEDVRVVDLNRTSTEEQRSTEWMRFHSLKEFLDPNDPSKTVEGYPAPLRAVLVARKAGR